MGFESCSSSAQPYVSVKTRWTPFSHPEDIQILVQEMVEVIAYRFFEILGRHFSSSSPIPRQIFSIKVSHLRSYKNVRSKSALEAVARVFRESTGISDQEKQLLSLHIAEKVYGQLIKKFRGVGRRYLMDWDIEVKKPNGRKAYSISYLERMLCCSCIFGCFPREQGFYEIDLRKVGIHQPLLEACQETTGEKETCLIKGYDIIFE